MINNLVDKMGVFKKWLSLAIVLIAGIIGLSECARIRARYVRVRYTSGYRSSSGYSTGSGGSGTSAGTIAAITLGSIAPLILFFCILCIIFSCCKKKEKRNAPAGRVIIISRSPQVISTIQAANTRPPNTKYPRTNDQQFTNLSFSMEPPKYNGLSSTTSK